jgi:hypothetical protein
MARSTAYGYSIKITNPALLRAKVWLNLKKLGHPNAGEFSDLSLFPFFSLSPFLQFSNLISRADPQK